MICNKTTFFPLIYISHIKNYIIIIINFVGRQDVTVNNYMRTVRIITHGQKTSTDMQSRMLQLVFQAMLEFNLQHCHELLNVHIFMIATVSAIARRYLGGRRGGGSVFVGEVCVHVWE